MVAHQQIEIDYLKNVKNRSGARQIELARACKITTIQGWIPSGVRRQGSKGLCQMIEAVIRSNQDIISWDRGTQGWLQVQCMPRTSGSV